MHRFRSTWLALVGGAVIVALSLSVAIGADPVNDDEADANRGQTISGFVHSLIFAQDDPADETVDEDQDEDEDTDEDLEEDTDEDLEEDLEEDTAREVPGEFANHGECVAEATHDKDAWEDEELKNHGAWVSLHARFLCWGLPDPNEEAAADEEAALDEDADTDETSAEARAAAKAERAEARAAARALRAEARDAAKAERTEVRAAGNTNRGNGGGNGGGHNKP